MDDTDDIDMEAAQETVQDLIDKVPGIGDLLMTLMQAEFKDEHDALVVAEAVGSFMAAVEQGKALRPVYLH